MHTENRTPNTRRNSAVPGWTLFTLLTAVAVTLLALLAALYEPSNAAGDRYLYARTPRPTRTAMNFAGPQNSSGASVQTATAIMHRYQLTSTAFYAKVAPTLTAINRQVKVTGTLPADEASQAISIYAQSVLGINVTVKNAGGRTEEVTRNIPQTGESSNGQADVVDLAVKTYAATLDNGAASLSYGSGKISGNVSIDVQDNSLGVYGFTVPVTGTGILDANSALALAKTTFPGLSGESYLAGSTKTGYRWYSESLVSMINAQTRQVQSTAQVVLLYNVPGAKGKASVTATVGRGSYAQAIDLPATR